MLLECIRISLLLFWSYRRFLCCAAPARLSTKHSRCRGRAALSVERCRTGPGQLVHAHSFSPLATGFLSHCCCPSRSAPAEKLSIFRSTHGRNLEGGTSPRRSHAGTCAFADRTFWKIQEGSISREVSKEEAPAQQQAQLLRGGACEAADGVCRGFLRGRGRTVTARYECKVPPILAACGLLICAPVWKLLMLSFPVLFCSAQRSYDFWCLPRVGRSSRETKCAPWQLMHDVQAFWA